MLFDIVKEILGGFSWPPLQEFAKDVVDLGILVIAAKDIPLSREEVMVLLYVLDMGEVEVDGMGHI